MNKLSYMAILIAAIGFFLQQPNAAIAVVEKEIVLVLDVSGSINSAELQLEIDGLKACLNNTSIIPHDGSIAVGIVTFATVASVELGLTEVTPANLTGIIFPVLNSLTTGGATNIPAGLQAAQTMLAGGTTTEQFILLTSDGVSRGNVQLACNAVGNAGITICAIGIGNGADISTLENCALATGGAFAFAPSFDDFLPVCEQCLGEVFGPLRCELEITSPENGAIICSDAITVEGLVTSITGGEPPYTITSCDVNGFPAAFVDTTFTASVPCSIGTNVLIASCTIVDVQGNTIVCSDTVEVICPAQPICLVEITSPEDGSLICSDSVTVEGFTTVTGGVPPFGFFCDVNGTPVTVISSSVNSKKFSVTLPCPPGTSVDLVATSTVIDSCLKQTVCRDTISVQCAPLPICVVDITSPGDGDLLCEDSVRVEGVTSVSGGVPPFDITCEVNGFPAQVAGSIFSAMVPLPLFENTLVANCAVVDSCGRMVVCLDSIAVIRDIIPPHCEFEFGDDNITGTFFDDHSGIKRITPLEIKNGTLTVDRFSPGAKKVKFRIDITNLNKNVFFNIEVKDMCRNKFDCDPVYLSLSADRAARQFDFTFPAIDRYLELTNHGLSEIRVDLNGNKFSLFSDASRAEQEFNAYSLPSEGRVTIDLEPYLQTGENRMRLSFVGLPGTRGEVLIAGETSGQIDYVLDLQQIPETFQLAQNYPNPFNPSTRIRIDIPNELAEGTRTRLRIFNVLGELVLVLLDDHKSPGTYVIEWSGRDRAGVPVPSGVYIYQLQAGDFEAVKKMLLLK